ncbi:BMC domain-containing protein [Proteus terrae subsp. cibarius]|uniref:BMC domain-containing protein n=1 Tax=Proteus terrae subsp. cibarius TaxID=626774 RepID=A0A6G6SB75_9GAMM|nr:BMC domain-containing protein [Proteus terrae]MBG2915665.1 BMC domain-containing protein [Proteus terrae subsp. cibarius]MBG3091682.1 BMC domain-containing protein [Proteus terrae subsp. cibarius]QGW04649.1 BMC domain-containing protein [Proteus terrae subsp. cibarius]QIF91944.1 BMC domain-containing protein [Proteus terrae subsp. cibarius]QIF99440.1 BMC domain-containing protein [Proteus terrae subsp. cibarius]
MNSLGVIETRGLTAAIQAADAACKAANVEIIGYRKVGSGLVSVCFQGEISAVRTAVDHGVDVVSQKELVIGSLVIARPEASVITKLLTIKGKKKAPIVAEKVQETAIEARVEAPVKNEIEHIEATKEIADLQAQNIASETKAVTDKAQSSKKELKPESRKGKK